MILIIVSGCSQQLTVDVAIEDKLHSTNSRAEIDFNFGWKFSHTEDSNAYKSIYDDTDWRSIRLPHDWSIEKEYSQTNTAGATGYLPGGTGWYRKNFATPKGGGVTQILFDGIYNHSEVWINGQSLGKRPYGYAPFHYDLTPYLKKNGNDNVIAVYVDRTRYVDSRWYTGSGIYRNVKLITTNKIHVPVWGTFITTPKIDNNSATVNIKTILKNQSTNNEALIQHISITDPSGKTIANKSIPVNVSPNNSIELENQLIVKHPKFWDITAPNLYKVTTTFTRKNNLLDNQLNSSLESLIDKTTTRFGIRTLVNDPETGFYLNGKNIKIKGVNLHHDGGLVGAAVPKGVWKRRFTTLKAAGVNAIRTAHNPASQEFLDLCDEMGFLVQAEAFDEWDNPKDKRKNFNQQGEVDYITESYSENFAA